MWLHEVAVDYKVDPERGAGVSYCTEPCATCWLSLADSQLSKTLINPAVLTAL